MPLIQVPCSTHDNNFPSPPPHPVGLHQTQTFSQLPSSISEPHTMFITNDGIDQDEDNSQSFDEGSQNSPNGITGSTLRNPRDTGHSNQLDDDEYSVRPVSTQREIKDVIAGHRQRNNGSRLPDNTQLLAVRNQQTSEASHSAHHTTIDDVDNLETLISACLHPPPTSSQASLTDVGPSPSQSKPAATSIASGVMPKGNSDPSHLQFYTPPVHDIIEHAKQISHCDIALVNLFPLCVDFNHNIRKNILLCSIATEVPCQLETPM
ncbi:hypothetical protein SCLCIDRAFT_33079 [Scleroderma citrinum Foug A]|uniref:Uncharacterized protein n=1 Tax=Scleroderma citrinum Foug A TaxID=1036808 RepID=A0A0C3D726_9AGAM|nr:hypothetical protein SCLCIDRAFT_33079 [Scleroderma citrinum Foug A]